ncbi:MAG: hydroxyacid dehydrogenase [Candidatus Marinimicrobia bacterium]|nr:hydroxyacid dehydrogenase [Candidatus Neomarinimicrobiota bacterium]
MRSLIIVCNDFDGSWPLVADYFHLQWKKQGNVEFIRLPGDNQKKISELVKDGKNITRMATFGYEHVITPEEINFLTDLKEWAISGRVNNKTYCEIQDTLKTIGKSGIKVISNPTEGFWKYSVAETGIGLTICGLRQIPQKHQAIQTSLEEWNYTQEKGKAVPGIRGGQYCDDSQFTSGTIRDKRVRVVGMGNIASHYSSICRFMGADVAAYDPFAHEPAFDLAGVRRISSLEELISDAEIFAPIIPNTEKTRGLITTELVNALPKGCLVVLITRAGICDMDAVRKRVLNDEISLASDVFDVEPLPLGDPLLGRHNVVHTPHLAGRTKQANELWADKLLCQFEKH